MCAMFGLGSLAIMCHVFLTWRACDAKLPVVKELSMRGAVPEPSRWDGFPSDITGGL